MVNVVGYSVVSGSFVDEETKKTIEYDNYKIFYVSDEVAVNKGMYCGCVSAKRSSLGYIGCADLDAWVGKEVILVPDLRNPKYISKVMLVK